MEGKGIFQDVTRHAYVIEREGKTEMQQKI